jgi:CubicO group peptidase (beta-lactamase class C family)
MATTNIFPRSAPEQQGIPSAAILAFVKAAQKSIQSLHSFMLLRHGVVVAEGWWYPYRPEAPHMLFSLSKSFTSTAVGLAVAEGRLSVDDTVLSFFPEDAPKKVSANGRTNHALAAMKVRHLLSMSTGHDQDATERTLRRKDRNAIKAFLSLSLEHAPGTHFVYNSAASYMLSAIVQKLTGQTLLDYLTPRLFEPLGIQGATWESYINNEGTAVNFGGWGLNVKTEDIARLGQLYLQKGVWNGKRLLSEAWVKQATSKQVSNAPNPNPDWEQGYGYQFWRCQPEGIYRGDGAFGQYCIVMPEQDAVLAITAGVPDMQAVLTLVWDKLLPAMGKDPLPADEISANKLARTLKGLKLAPPKGEATSPQASRLSGKTYSFERNYETLHSLSFDFEANRITYQLTGGGKRRGKHTLAFGRGAWVEGVSVIGGPVPQRVAASGVWKAEDTFELTLCFYETPFVATITCRFKGKKLFYDFKANVAFGPTERPQLVGKLV